MKQLPHLTCTRYAAVFALAAVLTTAAAQTAQAVPACDDRIAIDNPVRFPFETIAALRYDNDYDGDFESRGSGAVVGPHMVLTCGHCVYNRDNGVWNDDDIYIAPAMYQDNTNTTVYPFGTRIASEKRTNTKWTDQNYSPESDVDYGSLGFVCPFEDAHNVHSSRLRLRARLCEHVGLSHRGPPGHVAQPRSVARRRRRH